RVAPHIQGLSDAPARLFFIALVGLTQMRARRPELDDRLVHEAVRALARTAETRGKGVVYEHRADDLRAQALVHEIGAIFEAKDEAGAPLVRDDRDLLAALSALEKATGGGLRGEAETRGAA